MRPLFQDRNIEFSAPDTIRYIQNIRLQEHICYCRTRSPYYRELFKGSRLNSESISIDKLAEIPFTDKSDIERHGDSFYAVPSARIVDIAFSSGTMGNPIKIVYTDFDLIRLAYNEERSFSGCGITAEDRVLLTCTMDRCFIAGLAYFLGIRNLRATAIRNGHSSLESHYEIIKRIEPTAIVGVPTFLKRLALYLIDMGQEPASSAVSKLICIGEPLRGNDITLLKIGAELETIWNAEVYSTYASSETVTTFCECTEKKGGHLHPDLAIVEIIDNDGNVLAPGEVGEVVITPMAVEGMPLIRFKTGDISFLIDEPCFCGRYSVRLGPILGRKNQMMKINGTSIYPQSVYSILEGIEEISNYYIEVSDNKALSDALTVVVALRDTTCTADKIQNKLQALLRVKPEVIVLDEATVRRKIYSAQSRKPVRFFKRIQMQ